MDKILRQIQDTVAKYAQLLSKILKVDVEIVDREFYRIAGTGEYEKGINISIENEGYVYRKVLNTGESQIIREPGKNDLCIKCPKYKNCIEKFEMCVPIGMDDEIIGVIGLICFDEDQKTYILGNLDVYYSFLQQVAEFISAKASETIEREKTTELLELLNVITDELEEGVIVLDKAGTLAHANGKALTLLNLNRRKRESIQVKYEYTGKAILDKKEYRLTIEKKDYLLIGYMKTIEDSTGCKRVILIFNETETIKNQLGSLINGDSSLVFDNILGTSEEIMEVKNQIVTIAKSDSSVLITGESGVGKEKFGLAIHKASGRSSNPFIIVQCLAVHEDSFEPDLKNYIDQAKGGTIFLNEVDKLSTYAQSKLVEILEEIKSENIRIIAAATEGLDKLLGRDKFRKDLYYKLNVLSIEIPPLRQHIEDVKIVTYYYLNKYSKLFNREYMGVDSMVWKYMYKYQWPGNLREVENSCEYMINMMDSSRIITLDSIPKRIIENAKVYVEQDTNFSLNLKNNERELIKKSIGIYGNTTQGKKKAALSLGIGVATLYRKMEEYELNK